MAYERGQGQQERQWLEEKLEELRRRVEAGQVKQETAIAAAAESILQQHRGRRHYQLEVGPRQFRYEASGRAAAKERGEGHYLL